MGEICMLTARFILAIAVLLLASYVVAMNWGSALVSLRNKRRGLAKHHSLIPGLSVVLAVIAYLIYPRPDRLWVFAWPLVDIANWNLLRLPAVLLHKARQR